MKSIIVFYSLEGNCKLLSERISEACGNDILQIKPVKDYPTGILKYAVGGKAAVRKEKPKLTSYSFNADDYDLIILASPVWASTMAPPMLSFLNENKIVGKNVAVIASQTGSGAEKLFENVKEILKDSSVISTFTAFDPKSKNTEEQIEKAITWMNSLQEAK